MPGGTGPNTPTTSPRRSTASVEKSPSPTRNCRTPAGRAPAHTGRTGSAAVRGWLPGVASSRISSTSRGPRGPGGGGPPAGAGARAFVPPAPTPRPRGGPGPPPPDGDRPRHNGALRAEAGRAPAGEREEHDESVTA